MSGDSLLRDSLAIRAPPRARGRPRQVDRRPRRALPSWPNTIRGVSGSISILEGLWSGDGARAAVRGDDELGRCLTLARGAQRRARRRRRSSQQRGAERPRPPHRRRVRARQAVAHARVRRLGGYRRRGEAGRGHDLPARHVVHTVGPRYQRGAPTPPSRRSWCYRGSPGLCEAGARRSRSRRTGRKGYPIEAGAHRAAHALSTSSAAAAPSTT